MSRFATLRITALLAVAGLLVAACGSSATVTPVPSYYAPASTGPASMVPLASPANSTAPSASQASGAIPSFDLSKLGGTLPGVDSYRTSFTVGGVLSYQSVVVTKPVVAKSITAYNADGTVSSRFVVIGDKVWTADGPSAAFTVLPSSVGSTLVSALDPAMMLTAYSKMDFASIASNLGTETKNGVSAVHLRIDSTTAMGMAAYIPAGASIDIWVADAGYLVGWEMTGFPKQQTVLIEVTNFNDPANVVTAPAV